MSKVRVPVLGTVGKSIRVTPGATIGSQIETDLQLPDGSIPTLQELATALYVAQPPEGTLVIRVEPDDSAGGPGGPIFEDDIVDGNIFPRQTSNEIITGDWEFRDKIRIGDALGTDWVDIQHDGAELVFSVFQTDAVRFNQVPVYIEHSGGLRIYDATGTNYGWFNHTGTDLWITGVGGTPKLQLDNFTDIYVNDGAVLRLRDSTNNDYVTFNHTGSVLNVTPFQTTAIQFVDTDTTPIRFLGPLATDYVSLQQADATTFRFSPAGSAASVDFRGGLDVKLWDPTNTNTLTISQTGGGGSTVTETGNALNFAGAVVGYSFDNKLTVGGNLHITGENELRIYNATATESIALEYVSFDAILSLSSGMDDIRFQGMNAFVLEADNNGAMEIWGAGVNDEGYIRFMTTDGSGEFGRVGVDNAAKDLVMSLKSSTVGAIIWLDANNANAQSILLTPHALGRTTNRGDFTFEEDSLGNPPDVKIEDGGSLIFYDPTNLDSLTQDLDGTDYNWIGVGITDWNITGITKIQAGTVDADFDALTATTFAGILGSNLTNANAAQVISGAWDFNADVDLTGADLYIKNNPLTEWVRMYHDLNDFYFAFSGTTDWNITGVTSIQAGTVDADFDAITATSYGGITEDNLISRAAPGTISGSATFSASPTFSAATGWTINSTTPQALWYESDGTLNNKYWRFLANGETFSLDILNDAFSVSTSVFTVDRTGTTVDSVNFTSAVDIAGALTLSVVLDEAEGGTGNTSYTTGDLLYASSASVLSKLAAGTSAYVLTSNGPGVAPSWQVASGGSGLENVVEDLTPQLGGPLQSFGQNINMADNDYITFGSSSDAHFHWDATRLKLGGLVADQYFYIEDGMRTRFYNSTNVDYLEIRQTTGDSILQSTQHIYLNPASGHDVYVFDSGSTAGFRVYDSAGTAYIRITHSGGDANFAGTSSTDLNISGFSALNLGTVTNLQWESASQPWLVLDSTSSGDNWSAQGAGISVGESGKKGSAAIHMTYNGDGSGYIGMGTVDNTAGTGGRPTYGHFDFDYNTKNIRVGGNLYVGNSAGTTGSSLVQSVAYIESADSQNYGSINVTGAAGSSGTYSGYSINRRVVFMNSGTTSGIYNDTNNEWFLLMVENSYVRLYFNNLSRMETTNNGINVVGGVYIDEASVASADVASDGQIWVKNNVPNDLYYTCDTGIDYPVGYATYRRSASTTLDNGNQTLNMSTDSVADALVNGCWYSDNATAYTLTLEPSTDTQFPVGAQLTVWNEGTGVLTINEGSGTTLYYMDGSGTVTDTAGGMTLAKGGFLTIIRKSTTVYLAMGAGGTA
jgi:hypothetical protein